MDRTLERLWMHLQAHEFAIVFPGGARPNLQRFFTRELREWTRLARVPGNFRAVMGFVDDVIPDRSHMMVKLMLYASSPANAAENLERIASVLRRANVVDAVGNVIDEKGFARLLGRELPHGWGVNGAAGTMAHVHVCDRIDPRLIGEVEFPLSHQGVTGNIDIRVADGEFARAAENLGFDPAFNKEVKLVEVKTKERIDGSVEALEQGQVARMIGHDPDRACFFINGASEPAGRDVRLVAQAIADECDNALPDSMRRLRDLIGPLPSGVMFKQYVGAIANMADDAIDVNVSARRFRDFYFITDLEQLGLGPGLRTFGAG
jgi:hypothetical protein